MKSQTQTIMMIFKMILIIRQLSETVALRILVMGKTREILRLQTGTSTLDELT